MPPKKRSATSTAAATRSKKAKTEGPATKTTRARASKAAIATIDPKQYSSARCEAWFDQYEDPDDKDVVGPEGIEKLCQDLGIGTDSIEILVIAWKLHAKNMGYFTRSEWVDGFSRLEVDSLEKLRAKLPAFRNIFDSPSDSKELYMFAFVFAKENDSKNLPLELAKGMWKLVCPPEHFPLIPSFLAFLDEMAPVKVVNKDQWRSFWEFSVTVSYDLTGYDETSAWPLLFDEYVAWRRK